MEPAKLEDAFEGRKLPGKPCRPWKESDDRRETRDERGNIYKLLGMKPSVLEGVNPLSYLPSLDISDHAE